MDSAVEFQGLVLGQLDSLYNYALVLTRRSEDAEDLLQEVLVRGLQSFATYDRSLSFKGWMFTIIKNTYIDRFRRQRRLPQEEPLWTTRGVEEPVLSLDNPLCSVPLAPEDLLLRREAIEQVREAIRRLPDEMREVVELRDVEGLAYREIARVINRPIGTVMSRLYRGRNLLRTCLVELRRAVEPPPRAADQTSKAHDRL